MTDIADSDIRVFIDALTHYFRQLGEEPANVRSFYLADARQQEAVGELTGIIRLGGQYQGSVSFAAPRALIRYVLRSHRAVGESDGEMLDAVGEIANTLAGNARRHFGPGLDITVPEARTGGLCPTEASLRERPFVIRIDWKHYCAMVVVDIRRAPGS